MCVCACVWESDGVCAQEWEGGGEMVVRAVCMRVRVFVDIFRRGGEEGGRNHVKLNVIKKHIVSSSNTIPDCVQCVFTKSTEQFA